MVIKYGHHFFPLPFCLRFQSLQRMWEKYHLKRALHIGTQPVYLGQSCHGSVLKLHD